MEVTTIKTEPRESRGRRRSALLREEGKIPAVVYGLGKETEHLCLDGDAMTRELRKHHRVFQLAVASGTVPVFLQDVQYDPVTDETLHIDFLRIDLQKPMPIEVELSFLGVPVGQSKGGQLVRDSQRLRVQSLPSAIPHEIEVKVGGLDLGDQILAKELTMPQGVTLDSPDDLLICHMTA